MLKESSAMKKLADISAFESLCNGDNTRMYPPNPNQRAGLKTSREWAEEQGAKLQAGSIEELAEIMGDRYFMEYAR